VVKLPEDSGFPAFVAQRIEHLTTDQKVGGSSPSKRTAKDVKKRSSLQELDSDSRSRKLPLLAFLGRTFCQEGEADWHIPV
jgi:hypothetical protein